MGTHEQAVKYVTKLDTRVSGPFEFGTPAPGQGYRTDITKVINVPISQAAKDYPEVFFKYSRGIIARRDWSQEPPSYKKWEVMYIRPNQIPDGAYHIRVERKSVWRDGRPETEIIDHWDYYDYEKIAVADQPVEWRPFVKSIYRGYIPNRVETLYIVDVTSVTSGVGNTILRIPRHPEVPEDNLMVQEYDPKID